MSIDTVHLMSINTVHLTSIDIVHPTSIDTVHQPSIDTAHPPSINTVHLPSSVTTCLEAEKVEVLILMVDENGMLRDEEGQDPFQGLPHQDPRNHIEELEDLVSRSEQNRVCEYHMLCKIFPYSIYGDAFRWFSQLQPGSLTSWDDIERAFLYKFLGDAEATGEKEKNDKWDRFLASLDEEYMIPIQLLDDIMPKADEQHVFGELSRVEEAGTEDTTSTSTDGRTSTSTDGTTSTSTDGPTSTSTDGRTSTSTEGTTSTSTDDTTSTSTDGRTSTSTDGTTSTSTDDTTSTSIDGTTSTSIDSTTSTSTNGTTSTSIDDGKKEDTMEDFLELEEWLEDMDQNSEKKLDDDENTSRGDMETSPKASIGRHQPDEIDRHPPCIIDLHPPESIDRQPLLDEPHCFIVEMEPIEERMHESEASHNIVIPCAVVEVEFPIPPNRCMQLSPYIGVLDDPLHAEASQRGLRFRDKVDKGPAEAASIDTDQIPSNDTTDAISNDINKPVSIETATSPSIDTGRISKQKEFDVCGNLFDGETTTRSDKSGGRGGIGRRGKGPREVLSYHWSLGSQMVSGNPECAADASQSHLQSFEHSLLLR
uniref:Retrotransposon gag domain-containing protein n=1 Tax=Brassica oleracea var. oleracea TaxID=109376 RepID=A0A0D3ATQ5_BRAOL